MTAATPFERALRAIRREVAKMAAGATELDQLHAINRATMRAEKLCGYFTTDEQDTAIKAARGSLEEASRQGRAARVAANEAERARLIEAGRVAREAQRWLR